MKLLDIAENQFLFKEPDLPEAVMLKNGYFLERGSTRTPDRMITWHLAKLMDEEESVAVARMRAQESTWTWLDIKTGQERVHIARGKDFFDMKKFAEWGNEMLKMFRYP